MDILVKLIKKRKLGKLCRIGAGIIAAIGVIQVILQSYTLWQQYLQTRSNSFQGAGPYDPQFTIFLNYLPYILSSIADFIFYAIILYAAGTVFDALTGPADTHKIVDDIDDDDIDIEDGHIIYKSLKPEEILQSRKSAY